ncbi:MAG: L-fucokinase, partial [Candidatus Omnitrophota bacterium]
LLTSLSSSNIVWIKEDEQRGSLLDGHAGISRNTIYIFAYDLAEHSETELLKLLVHEPIELQAETLARSQEKAWTVTLAEANHKIAQQQERHFRAPEHPPISSLQTIVRQEVGDETILRRVLRVSEQALAEEIRAKTPSADVIILTAGTTAMAQAYESIYRNLDRHGRIIRGGIPLIAIADPMQSMGNGAALAYALHELNQRLPSLARDIRYPNLRGKDLEELRVVVIQAGGFGSRLAITLAHGSKPLMKIPSNLNPQTTANILDYVLKGAYKFTQVLKKQERAGLVVLNGDGLLITVAQIQDGANLIVYPETKKNAARTLGVVIDDNTLDRRVVEFREKPSLEELDDLVKSPIVFANTASCIWTDEPKKYHAFIESLLRIAEITLEAEASGARAEVDTSNDMLVPLALRNNSAELDLHREKRAKKITAKTPGKFLSVNEFYSRLYDEVVINFPELFATGDMMTTFYRDLGTTSTYIDEITGNGILSRILEFKKVVHSAIDPTASLSRQAFSLLSVIGAEVTVGDSIVYRSSLEKGSHIGDGSLVYVLGKVIVGNNEVFMQVPIQNGGSRIVSALLYFGAKDDVSKIAGEGSTIFGKDFFNWAVEHGLIDDDLNLTVVPGQRISIVDKKIFDLPFWPVCASEGVNMSLVAWMSTQDRRPTEEYLQAPKVSLKDITRNQTTNPRVFTAIMQRDEALGIEIKKRLEASESAPDGGYNNYTPEQTQAQLESYHASGTSMYPPASQEAELIGPYLQEALDYLRVLHHPNATRSPPVVSVIHTNLITFASYYDQANHTLYLEQPIINNPDYNLSAVFVHELNASSHQENQLVEQAFLSEFQSKADRQEMRSSMSRALASGWRVTNVVLTAFTPQQAQMYASQIDSSLYPKDTYVKALADPHPAAGAAVLGRAFGNGLANLGVIRRSLRELVEFNQLPVGWYDLRSFLNYRFLIAIHGGGASARNPKYTQIGKFNG